MMRLAFLLLVLVPFAAGAMEARMDAASLAHGIDRMGSTARVLYVAAHPDDENTRLLAWLANGRHVRAAYLSLTRGGGGQNLIGTEQGPLLDVIRTEELLAARGVDGAEQRFTRMRDFGFSKSPEEALSIWGREEALADVVHVIRSFRPDVIVTRFDEQRPNHGHHTASYLLAKEAFAAAADPAAFPAQIEAGLSPWQATRLLYNHSHWRGPPPAGALAIDVGGYDARRGLDHGEIAALSRSAHKSQGFGAAGERGAIVEHFVHVAGAPAQADLLDGVETRWARFGAAGRRVDEAIDAARSALYRDAPERAIRPLIAVREALRALPPSVRRDDALRDVDRLIAGAAGIFLRATADRAGGAPGGAVDVRVEVLARTPARVALRSVAFPHGPVVEGPGALPKGQKRIVEGQVALPADAPITTAPWLAEPPEAGRYVVRDPRLLDAPRGPAALEIEAAFEVEGAPLTLRGPVVHAWVDPVHGERVRLFQVVPPATVTPLREAVMIRDGATGQVALRVRAAAAGAIQGQVGLDLPPGWSAEPARRTVSLAPGAEETLTFEVRAPEGAAGITARPFVEIAGARWSWREDSIEYPHIPAQLVLQPASLRLQPVELELPEGIVGYVPGSGDSIPEDLAHVGVAVEVVDDATLRAGDLERYAAIVVGIRAYNTRPVVRAAHERLMRWVERGGVVLVQYNTTSPWEPLDTPIGPWPMELDRLARITDETAALVPVRADHPLLRTPHRLGPADFEGWVQERGLYFAKTWDDRYEPLFSVADPDEPPLRGGTLVARHGKGRYVYSGLSFFRQLRAGVPGAYRLFLNLIAGNRPDA